MVAYGSPVDRSEKHHHKDSKHHLENHEVEFPMERSDKHRRNHENYHLEKHEAMAKDMLDEGHKNKGSKHHQNTEKHHHQHHHKHVDDVYNKDGMNTLEKIKQDELLKQAFVAQLQDGPAKLRTTGFALKLPPKCKPGWKMDHRRLCRPAW
ncbi:hypothetical protein C0J52_11586 [Blattella germanica]|nr:hypothetical protein C0J52_11586 [Blattella germanica]